MQALRTAATGMAAQQLNVEVISNNIANMNTVGFKKQRAEFEDLLYQTIEQAGAQSSDQGNVVPTGVQIGAGVKAGSVYRITGQGTLTKVGTHETALCPTVFQTQPPLPGSVYKKDLLGFARKTLLSLTYRCVGQGSYFVGATLICRRCWCR